MSTNVPTDVPNNNDPNNNANILNTTDIDRTQSNLPNHIPNNKNDNEIK